MRRSTLLPFAPVLFASTLLAAPACDHGEFGIEPVVTRVVLTPGGSAEVTVRVERPPGLHQPVRLKVFGLPAGIDAELSETSTTADEVTLAISSDQAISPADLRFKLKAWVGPRYDLESIDVSIQALQPATDGYEEHAPGVNGEVETLEFDGEPITFEVVDGIAIANGDIVLGRAEDLRAAADDGSGDADDGFRSATCNFSFNTEFTCSRWTDGVIGYQIGAWDTAEETTMMRERILNAIAHWEANTGIRFVPRASGEYLEFRNGGGCSSNVGRAVITGFDSQSISLSTRCGFGSVVHEIGHAVGLYHEQSRDDRDSNVVVDFGRVQDGKLHNFFQFGEYERDRGPYDYGSIMHYGRAAFARNAAACNAGTIGECTIRPNVASAVIGQRGGLSEGDILGVYTLYPPEYVIQGGSDGETSDRFLLTLDYDTPTPDASRIVWRSNRVSEPLGTGHFIDLRAGDLPAGAHVITAEFVVLDTVVTSRSVSLNFVNDAPVVTLRASNGQVEQQLGQPFTVVADVTDTEDGNCPPEICDYQWLPTPSGFPLDSNVASFTYDVVGARSISLYVEDTGNTTGMGSLSVIIVNTEPTATILEPAGDLTLPLGSTLPLEGVASDINTTFGTLPCSALTWSSSNPGDTFSPSSTGCSPSVSFAGGGARTISVIATDPQGLVSDPDTITVTLASCGGGNCPPSATLGLPAPHFGDAYFIEQDLDLVLTMSDAESGALDYEVRVRRAGDIDAVLRNGTFAAPPGNVSNLERTVVLGDAITQWPLCSGTANYREYELILSVTDTDGTTTSDSAMITVGCDFV